MCAYRTVENRTKTLAAGLPFGPASSPVFTDITSASAYGRLRDVAFRPLGKCYVFRDSIGKSDEDTSLSNALVRAQPAKPLLGTPIIVFAAPHFTPELRKSVNTSIWRLDTYYGSTDTVLLAKRAAPLIFLIDLSINKNAHASTHVSKRHFNRSAMFRITM